jgi:hypothetical protein
MTSHSPAPEPDDQVEIDARELSGIFAVPQWLRGAGQASWLLVGLTLLLVGIIWLLALTNVIVLPLIAAGIVAAVASPLVAWMHGHGLPRGIAAALMMLAIILGAIGMTLVVVGGIIGQAASAGSNLSSAQDKITGWVEDLGVSHGTAEAAKHQVSTATTDSVTALLHGVAGGLSALSSIVFFLAMTALSLFFLLKDGPTIRAWSEKHMGVRVTSHGRSLSAFSAPCAGTSSGRRSSQHSTRRWSRSEPGCLGCRWWGPSPPSPSSPPTSRTSAPGAPGRLRS